MTEGVPTLSTPPGVPADDFERLLEAGRQRGSLTPDDLMLVLEAVELSPELIDAVVLRVRAEGITYVEDEVTADDDEVEDPTTEVPAVPAAAPTPPARTPRARPAALEALEEAAQSGGPGADPVRMYLKEIGKVPLLTAEQEVSLARRIESGLAAAERIAQLEDDYGSCADIPPQTLFAEERVVTDGLAAKSLLIEANLRLVVSIAKRYRNRGLLFLDLIPNE
jgi:RNA polymerase primary sigma factor